LLKLGLESFDPLKHDVRDMHDKLVNRVYLAAVIIAPFIILSNVAKFAEAGRVDVLILQALFFMSAAATYFFRRKIPYALRALGILFIILVLAVGSLYSWGLIGGGIPSLIILCIFSTVFLGRSAGLVSLLLSLLSIAIIGWLVIRGIIVFDLDMNEQSRSFTTWLIGVISFLVYMGLTVLALGNLLLRTDSFIKTLRQRAIEMEQAKVELEREISERKKIEGQLLQVQKMEAIGRLAGGVAHDFNNHLMVIINLMEKIQSSFDPKDPRSRFSDLILSASNKSADLTGQLLAFSRKQIAEPKVFNLRGAIQEMVPMLRSLISENIELSVEEAKDSGNIRMDRVHLEQVILNLAVNAKDTMSDGGKLTIEIEEIEVDEEYAKKHFSIEPGQYVMLAVSDTGQGMDRETLSHIFEPFFTTKEKEKGTGLGLATVYGIVKQAGGDIIAYSEIDAGTTFKIYLPRVDDLEDSVEIPIEKNGQLVVGEGETILVAEDDDLVRETALNMLTSNGYKVIEARSGEVALEQFKKHRELVDMVLTDVVMTGMNGKELAQKIGEISPRTGFLFISGYTENVIANQEVLDPGIEFLQKPFTTSALLGKIRAVLKKGETK